MTSVESAVPVKTPEPDQYWEHVKSKDRVYFIGRNPEGVMVWQCEGDTVEVGDLDWSDWQHIPGCSGWQWEPVPADVFPQYWTSPSDKYAYLLRYNEQRCVLIDKLGRRLTDSPWYASDTNGRTQLTRDDALALLDKPAVGCADIQNGPIVISNKQANEIQAILDNPSETWRKYYVCDAWPVSAYVRRYSDGSVTAIGKDGSESHWDVETKFPDVLPDGWREVTEYEALARVKPVEQWPKYYATVNDSRHYYRCDSADEVWAVTENGEERQGSPAYILLDTAVWKEITEAEAKARIKTTEVWPKYVVNPDESCRWYIKRISENSAQHVSSNGIESPEWWGACQNNLVKDGVWNEVTESEAIARVIDSAEHDSDPPPFSKPFTSPRSGMGIRKDAVAWRPNAGRFDVTTDVIVQAEAADSSALPMMTEAIESPNGWVVQDRVPGRPGIDQGWWAYKGDAVDPSGPSWWDFPSTDSAAGREHGYQHIAGHVLHLRCRRKDLPQIPSPVVETFPQWYILKESELRSWVQPWAIERRSADTCIRYACDEAGNLSSETQEWYGGTDAWQRCTAAEAMGRLGVAMLPAVPSEPRRVPVKLWVTYRLNDEGGDWPVRATQADQTCHNWKEIKFDGNGAFIEVES